MGVRRVLLLLGIAGCAGSFEVGLVPIDSPPADPVDSWRVLECENLAAGSTLTLPGGGLTYYLTDDADGRSLYEFDAAGRGARYLQSFAAPDGLHFVNYRRGGHGYEIVVPLQPEHEGARLVYQPGAFKAYKDGEVTKLRGSPRYRCPFAL